MGVNLDSNWAMAGRDRSISEAFMRQRGRLRDFIRKRVPNPADAEDILQEVFYELVEAARLVRPVEQVGAWLFRVARNRITDLFRKKQSERIEALAVDPLNESGDAAATSLADLLPAADGGPEAAYARRLLLEELDAALDELPEEQRRVFIAHELEGRSFKELAALTGASMNTLLSRKRYAVLHLRRRLQAIYDEFADT
jgi:RNA polymerase sigma factor (sigma-70 family)